MGVPRTMSVSPESKPQREPKTSSTAQTVTGPWTFTDYTKRSWRLRERLAAWYMGRIAGRYCPCEWPYKSRWLIRLCGRIDDAYCNAQFRDFCHYHLAQHRG